MAQNENRTEVVTLDNAFGEFGCSGPIRILMYQLTVRAALNSSSCMFYWGMLHMRILCSLKQAVHNIPESQWIKQNSKGKTQREVFNIKIDKIKTIKSSHEQEGEWLSKPEGRDRKEGFLTVAGQHYRQVKSYTFCLVVHLENRDRDINSEGLLYLCLPKLGDDTAKQY